MLGHPSGPRVDLAYAVDGSPAAALAAWREAYDGGYTVAEPALAPGETRGRTADIDV